MNTLKAVIASVSLLFPFFPCTAEMHLECLAVKYHNGTVSVLNQQKLPREREWITPETPEQMVNIIRALQVRGATIIGISGAFSIAQLAERGASIAEIEDAVVVLKNARPTAVNLRNYLDRILDALHKGNDHRQDVLNTVQEIFYEDFDLCESLSRFGADLIQPNECILTYCNTGSLASAGMGSALGVIKMAHLQNKNIHVYACETRPLLQGGRLTAFELELNNIPYTIICDNMAASLMKSGKIQRVLVGADRIAANGDFANKIGTYSLAVLAKHHNIPFHAVAPYTTIDKYCPNGEAIIVEERAPDEVRGVSGSFGSVQWTPKNAPVFNPAFDVTPADLVTSYILDKGCVPAELIPDMVP